MSKIGQKQIEIKQGVKVVLDNTLITVTGPKGELKLDLPKILDLKIDGNIVSVVRKSETSFAKAQHGLFRSILANAMEGVVNPWQKKLEIHGTGFGVTLKGSDAVFKIGFSHQITFPKVDGVTYAVDGQTNFMISGINKQLVGEVAHKVRLLRPPDAYKGKGIRYAGEVVKLKPGKKAKTA